MKLLDFILQTIFVQDRDCRDYKPIPEHHRLYVKDTDCTNYKQIPEHHGFNIKNTDCLNYEPIPEYHRFNLKDLAGSWQNHNSETKSIFEYLIIFGMGQRIGANSADDQGFNS